MPKGVDIPCYTRTNRWTYLSANVREGQPVTGGDVIGIVYENEVRLDVVDFGFFVL